MRQIVTECNNTCSGFSPPNIIHVVPQLYTIEKNSRIPPLSAVLPIIMFCISYIREEGSQPFVPTISEAR